MRALLAAGMLATAMLVIGPIAEGQTPATQQPVIATPSVNLTSEQRHVIKEIVLKDLQVPKVTADVPMAVGGTVPQSVTLQSFPADVTDKVPQVKSHEFFVKGDRVVIVSPKDNKIADVID
jgi:hypothetical protein